MILVDTSVWIDHLNSSDALLAWHLEQGEVLMHPFVLGELACGNLRNRAQLLELLQQLPCCAPATDREVLHFIEQRQLAGTGIGYVDAHLLAAVALGGTTRLWTRDKRLGALAHTFGYAAQVDDDANVVHDSGAVYRT
ncbi:MAG TPA: PIN domain-containing protein [Hyphomicrobiales bacterium]|nr:PIN domain-containing protein [Hyphomicrobiales bacterium]